MAYIKSNADAGTSVNSRKNVIGSISSSNKFLRNLTQVGLVGAWLGDANLRKTQNYPCPQGFPSTRFWVNELSLCLDNVNKRTLFHLDRILIGLKVTGLSKCLTTLNNSNPLSLFFAAVSKV